MSSTQPSDTSMHRFDLLQGQIAACMVNDRHRLAGLVTAVGNALRNHKPAEQFLAQLTSQVERSLLRSQQRRERLPKPVFTDDLPLNQRRTEIAELIAAHPVVIVCGETGSGKTTQLPKICLELQRGVTGMIGCTQPRRIAARTVAARIASELGSEVGGAVGYKIRFSDKIGQNSYIKVMTDGILLAETQGDRWLDAYDTIIIDEAHERSLNIDFLLGYLKQLLPKRPDLKLIVTSATIDVERFSRHFDNAPVVEVSGRTYPVDVVYRPVINLEDDEDESEGDVQQAILDAVDEVSRLSAAGDILIFLSGEREIRDTAESLRKHHPPRVEILPLFARLSAAEQNQVFHPGGARRIILATNVAETSLTVPRIRYVIDTGYARIKRYSYRSKVELLHVEKISRASAAQRAGRCGRVMSGVCVRLYSEDDYRSRPDYTEPEIRRSNLAGVVLRMQDLGLGHVERFPFLEPPDARMINDGYRLLAELGAVDDEQRLTAIGKQLAKLPIDPKIGRMVLAAQAENCLSEVLIIAAALSVPDPRQRPMEAQQAADEKHRQLADEQSDFLSYLKLWAFFDEALKHKKSNRKLARQCHEHFLSMVHLREWRDIHQQLHLLVTEMGMRPNQVPAAYDEVHRALLAGLLGNIGFKDENQQYLGTRGAKFAIFPGSTLFKRGPKWVVAAELAETTRLYARNAAKIEPEWIEKVAGDLCKRHYFEPHWEKKAAQVVAFERVSLFGLIINPKRRVNYGPLNPLEAREIFIRAALVDGDFETRAAFFEHNRKLITEVQELEHKSRRQDVLVDNEHILAFYNGLIPQTIYNGPAFEKWRKEAERQQPKLLFIERDYLMRHAAQEINEQQFPDTLKLNGIDFKLSYYFDPRHPADGVTLTVPLHLLNQIDPRRMEWLVPGQLREKIAALIRALPQSLRRNFVPAPETVKACMEALKPGNTSFIAALSGFLHKRNNMLIPDSAWALDKLPEHLRMNFKIVDDAGKYLAMSRKLDALKEEFGAHALESFSQTLSSDLERTGITRWDFGDLPEKLDISCSGQILHGYPALVDNKDSVALKVFDAPDKAEAEMRAGMRRLFMLTLRQQVGYLEKSLPVSKEMILQYMSLGGSAQLKEGLFFAVIDWIFSSGAPPRSADDFARRAEQAKARLVPAANEMSKLVGQILAEYHAINKTLSTAASSLVKSTGDDIRAQISHLIGKDFLRDTPHDRLQHYPRYLAAIRLRLDKLRNAPVKDSQYTQEIARWWQLYLHHKKRHAQSAALEQFRWMIEELRVSLFAQELKTPFPVSAKRLEKHLEELQLMQKA